MFAVFVEAVDSEASVIADITDFISIGQEEAMTFLHHVMETAILRLKCVWVVEK